MKTKLLGLIAIVSIALAGCGSSGSSSDAAAAAAAPSSTTETPVDLSTVEGVSTPSSVQVVTANP